jgi:hypothetical protein
MTASHQVACSPLRRVDRTFAATMQRERVSDNMLQVSVDPRLPDEIFFMES